jgi:hypothetical protein
VGEHREGDVAVPDVVAAHLVVVEADFVEPYAGDDVADNLNPVGRLYYSASTLICTPASLSQDVGTALGAQASEARLRAVAAEAGFTRFRRPPKPRSTSSSKPDPDRARPPPGDTHDPKDR